MEKELNSVVSSSSNTGEVSLIVTGRAFDPLVQFADDGGWDQTNLLEGLSVSEEDLRNSSSRIPWTDFVKYLERFEAKIGGPEEMHRLGEYLKPSYSGMASFVGLMAHPRIIYSVINRWGGPSMFPSSVDV